MADFEDGDIIRIGAVLTYDGSEDIVNVYHIRQNSGGDIAWSAMDGYLQIYMDALVATIDTEWSTLITAKELQVTNVTQLAVYGAIAWGTFSQGGAAGEPTASGVACFGFIRTRKPRVQIRKYYGVFPQGAMIDGLWDAGVTGAVGDSLDYHRGAQQVGGVPIFQGVAYNRTLLTYELGVTTNVRSEPGYQRRRKRGVGS